MSSLPNVHVVSHPLLAAKLAAIGNRETDSTTMRRLVSQATSILAVVATESTHPSTTTALVPLMRSGLAMVDPVLHTMEAGNKVIVHHLGLFRDKQTLEAVEYYNNIPTNHPPVGQAIIVDPLLATGATGVAAVDTLREWSVEQVVFIALIATRNGIERVNAAWPGKVSFFIGQIQELDETGYIAPGVGDIGDRLYL